MTELRAKRSEDNEASVVTIRNGKVNTDDSELQNVVEGFTDMEIMVGQEPIKPNDTPAEEFKDATDQEIAATLTGVLRTRGWGVDYTST